MGSSTSPSTLPPWPCKPSRVCARYFEPMIDTDKTAWEKGYSAYREQPDRQACPYVHDRSLRTAWLQGWLQAAKDGDWDQTH